MLRTRPSPRLLLALAFAACGGGAASPATDAGAESEAEAESEGGGDGPEYARLFPADRVVDVDLTFTDDAWETLMAKPRENVYVEARLTYDGIVIDPVGVRLKGNSSRNFVAMMGSDRFSFKVDTDRYVEGQDLLGVDKINLNNGFKDPSCLRERLATDLYRTFGVPTIRSAHVRLSRNGEYFGLYTVVEQVDKDFLRDRFADDEGDLYKPEPPSGDLAWRGDDFGAYMGMDLESHNPTDHAPLLAFLDTLNNSPDLETDLPRVFDVDGYLRYLAVTIAVVSLDSYLGMSHNYYLYQDLSAGLFRFIPWDTNEAYGNFWCMMATPDQILDWPYEMPACPGGGMGGMGRPLVTRVLAVPAWMDALESHLADLIAGDWAPDPFYGQVHAMADLVRDDVAADPTAFYPYGVFEASLDEDTGGGPGTLRTFGLTSFADRRADALAAQLP